MHAAALADSLSVDQVVVPRPSGVLSAFGLLAADESYDAARTVGADLRAVDPADLEGVYDDLVADVLADASDPDAARLERAADCRYAGQSFELTVPVDDEFDAAGVAERFHDAHERAHGYAMDESIEIVTLRATATVPGSEPTVRYDGAGDDIIGTRRVHFAGGARSATVFDRDRLAPGATVSGPAILEQAESTTVVPPAWAGNVLADGTLVLTRASDTAEGHR